MLFFITLGNCATSKSKVCNVFSNVDGEYDKIQCLFDGLGRCE